MKEISDQELAAVMALPAQERYSYFVRCVADTEELWTLRNEEDFVLYGDDDRRELVPVWPHRRFAEANGQDSWDDTKPFKIDLDRWLAAWTTGLEVEGRFVAVFPLPSQQGIVVSPAHLAEDLMAEAGK
jgi:Protein of unknown function (DUF2750)